MTTQAKDLPEHPILEHLAYLTYPHKPCGQWDGTACARGHWTLWFDPDKPYSMYRAFPPATPFKLALAKMRKLERRQLISGCTCGCRGDFEITPKGMELLTKGPQS